MNPDITSDIEEHSKELSNDNDNFDASLTFDNQIKEISSSLEEIKHGEYSTKKNNKTAIIEETFSVSVIALIAVISVVFYIKNLFAFVALTIIRSMKILKMNQLGFF